MAPILPAAALLACSALYLHTPPPADQSPRVHFGKAELTVLYGLQDAKPRLAARILPPPPARYPLALAPQTDPLMLKPVKTMDDREIDTIVFRTAQVLHAYWTREFARRGGEYIPVEVYLQGGPAQDVSRMPTSDRGTRFVDGVVYADRDEIREAGSTWMCANGSLIESWTAHEIAHYIAHVTGVRSAAYKNAVYDPGYRVIATKRLPGKPAFPLQVHVERQAQYLAGVSLREAGLLRRGDPENIYYASVASGDDYGRVAAKDIKNPLSAEYFKNDSDHGWGKDYAKAIYEGLLPSGTVDTGLELLGTKPNYNTQVSTK